MANPRVTFDFKADISQINQAIQKIDQRLDRFGGKAKQQTEGFAGGMAKFGLAVSGVQQAFGMLDQTIGAVARKITEMGGGFEHAMNKVKAVTGASKDDFNALRDSAIGFGQSTAKSASEVAKLQFELSKLGFNTEEIQGATEGILSMAIAFDVDLARSAEVAGGVLRQFSIDASEAGGVADLMAKAFSTTALDTEKFANAMVYVGQIAPQAGFELHEVTALLGVLSNKMVDSSIAGTALSKIMEQMANDNSDLAKEIGHPVQGMEGFVEVLNKMNEEGTDLSDLLGFVLPRTAKTFGVLVNSAKEIDALTKSFENLGGEAKKMEQIMMEDLIGANLLIDSAMEGLWITIADELTPAFMELKRTQIAFIQGIDTEEVYAYASGFTAVGVAVAYFNRTALIALMRMKAIKVALATSGWGLAIVAIGSIVGALIDATEAFADDTDEIDRQNRSLERNKELLEELKTAKEEITSINDIQELEALRVKRTALNEEIRKSSVVEKQVVEDILANRRKQSATSIQLTGQTFFTRGLFAKKTDDLTLESEKVNRRAYGVTRALYEQSVEDSKDRIVKYEADIARETKVNTEASEERIKGREKMIASEKENIVLMSERQLQLMQINGLNEAELKESLAGSNAKLLASNKTLDIIDIQMEKLEALIKKENEKTATSEDQLKLLVKIEKAEIKMREIVLKSALELDMREKMLDADKFERQMFTLDTKRLNERQEVNDLSVMLKVKHEILKKQISDDKTLTDAQRTQKEKDLASIEGEQLTHVQALLDIDAYFAKATQKIQDEKDEHDEELHQDKIAKAQELGFVMVGEVQREFDVYIAFLDEKILAEEAYSEKWFELMDHRQSKYDEHIAHQLATGRMSTVDHMAMLSEQLSAEDLTTERKIELQEQMIQASTAFMEEGGMIHKAFLKKELVDFISAQQLKLLGKLAEILAMGASTLGVSLAVQLPLYAGAIAVLEGAKSKVMAFEKGGLIDKPTMALMGEAGPEIVIPEKGFKDYVTEQIIPFQAQALGVPLSNFTNQNFISNSVNMNRQEQLTEINTSAIQKMSGEIGTLSKTMNLPQGVTITDGSTIISAEMERGRLN